MSRDAVLWVLVLFFGGTVLFGGLRRLTEDEPAWVIATVQVGALALVIAAVVAFTRWRR